MVRTKAITLIALRNYTELPELREKSCKRKIVLVELK